jgi:hypothetical protein
MARHFQPAWVILFLLLPVASSGTSQRIEAESFYSSGQIADCGMAIGVVACSEASGGYGVDGVDCNGEWIKLHLSLTSRAVFFTALRSAGAIGYVRTFRVDYLSEPLETPVASVTLVTVPGSGVS